MLSNTKMTAVHYKGVNEAYPAIANGDVHWIISAPISAMPLVKAGRLRAIAVTSAKRAKAMPDLPTIAESGVRGYEMVGWFGLFAPARTPRAIVDRLSAEARRGLQQPDFAARAEAQGTENRGQFAGGTRQGRESGAGNMAQGRGERGPQTMTPNQDRST